MNAFSNKNLRNKDIQEKNPEEFGFGKAQAAGQSRMINEQGKFNIIRVGTSLRSGFHTLIEMRWSHFFVLVFSYNLLINLIFGMMYYLNGPDQIVGLERGSPFYEFMQCFFFSVQTTTTVGYGGLHPHGYAASSLASIGALIGLLSFALFTGLVYSRFSKPKAKILYSKNFLIAPYKEGHSIQVRAVNAFSNTIIDMEATMIIAFSDLDTGNRIIRTLGLEISKIAMFPLNWTIVHALDEQSPISHVDFQKAREMSLEIVILLRGYDESYNQTVHSMKSYGFEDQLYMAKFKPMFDYSDNQTQLYLDRISDFEWSSPSKSANP